MISTPSITPVTALVDWNSQIHAAKSAVRLTPLALAEHTLGYVGKTIGDVLTKLDSTKRFDVVLRLYHGWHKGFEPTARKRAVIDAFASTDFRTLSRRSRVVIRPQLNFGDNLLSATPLRLHLKIGCHLPNTLRHNPRNHSVENEKMVDTAIASDLVDLAHSERKRWLLILADDDDLVPPTFVAEGVRNKSDGKIVLIRNRPNTPFLKLDELRIEP
jgi:hypothetical protein